MIICGREGDKEMKGGMGRGQRNEGKMIICGREGDKEMKGWGGEGTEKRREDDNMWEGRGHRNEGRNGEGRGQRNEGKMIICGREGDREMIGGTGRGGDREMKGWREDVGGTGDREKEGGRKRKRGGRDAGRVCVYVCRIIIYSYIHMTRRDNSWVIRPYACNLQRQILIFGSVIAI